MSGAWSSLASYKRHWCRRAEIEHQYKISQPMSPTTTTTTTTTVTRMRRQAHTTPATTTASDFLLNEVIDDLNRQNLRQNAALMKLLADSVGQEQVTHDQVSSPALLAQSAAARGRACEPGFVLDAALDKCVDRDECTQQQYCDTNAECVNVRGSFRCACRAGFIGDGTPGNCLSGELCSGRYCRLNGACTFVDNAHGYRCQCMLACQNGGMCVMTPYRYECKCPPQLTGALCNETVQNYAVRNAFDNSLANASSSLNARLSDFVNLVSAGERRGLPDVFLRDANTTAELAKLSMFNMLSRYVAMRPVYEGQSSANNGSRFNQSISVYVY